MIWNRKKEEWVSLGTVGVDSGQLMVCDPCYIGDSWEKEPFDRNKKSKKFSYLGACTATNHGKGGQIGGGLGVAFRSGAGDGEYEVKARIVQGEVAEIRILFDGSGDTE